MKQPAIYIITNKKDGVLYTGITSNLIKRIFQHKNNLTPGFTSKYNCKLLVYFELLSTMEIAIAREKQIKAFSRKKKIALIQSINGDWNDLYVEISKH